MNLGSYNSYLVVKTCVSSPFDDSRFPMVNQSRLCYLENGGKNMMRRSQSDSTPLRVVEAHPSQPKVGSPEATERTELKPGDKIHIQGLPGPVEVAEDDQPEQH